MNWIQRERWRVATVGYTMTGIDKEEPTAVGSGYEVLHSRVERGVRTSNRCLDASLPWYLCVGLHGLLEHRSSNSHYFDRAHFYLQRSV